MPYCYNLLKFVNRCLSELQLCRVSRILFSGHVSKIFRGIVLRLLENVSSQGTIILAGSLVAFSSATSVSLPFRYNHINTITSLYPILLYIYFFYELRYCFAARLDFPKWPKKRKGKKLRLDHAPMVWI